ncbi:MAG TPA: isochorismatase family cysteine hydrolase [Dongiaceae bacterium]
MFLREPIANGAIHLCIDMQRLLASEGPWPTPWVEPALERSVRLVELHPAQTMFTRFVPPHSAAQMPGTWRRFFEKWRSVTQEFIDPALLELLPPLASFVPPAVMVDKGRYSAFVDSNLQSLLHERSVTTLVVSGAETDVCVLSTVLSAVDLGYRVIVAADAICSSVDKTHDALMTLYSERFGEQIERADTDAILQSWQKRRRTVTQRGQDFPPLVRSRVTVRRLMSSAASCSWHSELTGAVPTQRRIGRGGGAYQRCPTRRGLAAEPPFPAIAADISHRSLE